MKHAATIALALGLLTFTGLAHAQTAPEPLPGAEQPAPGRFYVGGMYGYGMGSSLGGAYEDCDKAKCSEHTAPASAFRALRLGYELNGGLGFSAELGQVVGIEMVNRRQTTMYGEQQIKVPVDVKDEVKVSGVFVGIAVSYTFMRKPIIGTASLGGGQWYSTLDFKRSGTAAVDGDPARRLSTVESGVDNTEAIATTITVFTPEVRFAYPLHKHFELGVSLGMFMALGAEVRPKAYTTPGLNPDKTPPRIDNKPVGFVPQPNSTFETAMETFAMFRGAIDLRVPF